MPKFVMVLNDGTTYTDLDGCSIVAVPSHLRDDEVDEFVKHADGYFCFGTQPGVESNNGMTLDDLVELDNESDEFERRQEDYEHGLYNWRRRNL